MVVNKMAINYSELSRQTCVYAIINNVNGKLYIGSAKDLRRRFWHHKSDLKLGKHASQKLQRAWDKYGENSFSVVVLMPSLVNELLQYEQMFIDFYDVVKEGYNCNPKAESQLGQKRSDKTKALISAAGKKRWEDPSYREKATISAKKSAKTNKVYCIETMQTYNGVRDAAKATGTDSSTIVKVANGKLQKSHGLTFRYMNENDKIIEPIQTRHRTLKRPVECNGIKYESLKDAAQAMGVSCGLASEAASGKRKIAKGHTFRYL